MSRLMGPPSKLLPSDWKNANQEHFKSSEAKRKHSEKLTAECQRLIDESNKTTELMQQNAQNRLELEQKFEQMVQEVETLLIFKSRVEKALESCAEPLQVTGQCLMEREKRVAMDLVHDEVEEELLKEKEMLEGVMQLLQRTLEQINEQIRLIRSVKYYLDKDLQDKAHAERIDDFCSLLTNTSSGVDGGNSSFKNDGAAVTPEEWEGLCNMNISKAEKEKNNSLSLRALVDSLLLEIGNQEKNMEALRVAMLEKEAPLNVAQTRLSTRSQRPNIELCYDQPQIQLLAQVKELNNHVDRLSKALELSEIELQALAHNQLRLEEEIQVKANTLYIDEVICHQLRQHVSIHSF
ncbi:hypothetical protein DNTS_005972 [Danionella cerebrum]|uniref:Tektin n=1 Tax=Danionella cerebrum TaxID=2873325 RepID=A0A553QCD5_9TELE|nr:hypothetical protein DNTS_005972 [Danionella translucida]